MTEGVALMVTTRTASSHTRCWAPATTFTLNRWGQKRGREAEGGDRWGDALLWCAVVREIKPFQGLTHLPVRMYLPATLASSQPPFSPQQLSGCICYPPPPLCSSLSPLPPPLTRRRRPAHRPPKLAELSAGGVGPDGEELSGLRVGRPVGPLGLTRPALPGGASSHQSRLRSL